MEPNPTYKVHFTGSFQEGVEPQSAISAFATLAKIPVEKAQAVLAQPRVLKKQLEIKTAHAYRDKLETLGLQVTLQPEAAEKQDLELSLEPIADRHASSQEEAPSEIPIPSATLPNGEIVCPKCGHQQQAAAQCEACGVYIHKVKAQQESNPQPEPEPAQEETAINQEEASETHDPDEPKDPRLVAVVAATGVAIACAFLWKLIAVVSEYEVGIVAWAIGGAIGFSCIALGSIGIRTAFICGALALCSIAGGKYLVQDYFIGELHNELQAAFSEEGIAEIYQQQADMAQHFIDNVHTDSDMRQFMVDYGYSESESPSKISEEELKYFQDEEAIYMQEYINNNASGEAIAELDATEFVEQYAGYSTWDAVKESLGIIDFLFFFLGIGTAFRMGLTGRVS